MHDILHLAKRAPPGKHSSESSTQYAVRTEDMSPTCWRWWSLVLQPSFVDVMANLTTKILARIGWQRSLCYEQLGARTVYSAHPKAQRLLLAELTSPSSPPEQADAEDSTPKRPRPLTLREAIRGLNPPPSPHCCSRSPCPTHRLAISPAASTIAPLAGGQRYLQPAPTVLPPNLPKVYFVRLPNNVCCTTRCTFQ